MATPPRIDPARPGQYPIILSDALLGKPSSEAYTGVRSNHKPALSSETAPDQARIKQGANGASYTLGFSDKGDRYQYTGTRTDGDSQYVLVFDPARKAFVLHRLDSLFHMNLTRTPSNSNLESLRRAFPPLEIRGAAAGSSSRSSGASDPLVASPKDKPQKAPRKSRTSPLFIKRAAPATANGAKPPASASGAKAEREKGERETEGTKAKELPKQQNSNEKQQEQQEQQEQPQQPQQQKQQQQKQQKQQQQQQKLQQLKQQKLKQQKQQQQQQRVPDIILSPPNNKAASGSAPASASVPLPLPLPMPLPLPLPSLPLPSLPLPLPQASKMSPAKEKAVSPAKKKAGPPAKEKAAPPRRARSPVDSDDDDDDDGGLMVEYPDDHHAATATRKFSPDFSGLVARRFSDFVASGEAVVEDDDGDVHMTGAPRAVQMVEDEDAGYVEDGEADDDDLDDGIDYGGDEPGDKASRTDDLNNSGLGSPVGLEQRRNGKGGDHLELEEDGEVPADGFSAEQLTEMERDYNKATVAHGDHSESEISEED